MQHEFFLSRRSIRKYKKAGIEEAHRKAILECAAHAPMANKEYGSWRLILVDDRAAMDKIARESANQLWVREADFLIIGVVLGELSDKWKIVDTAIALEHVVLAAESLGYGSCWVGAFDEPKLKEILDIPPRFGVLAYISVGVKGEQPEARSYRDPAEVVYRNKFRDR
jgi:nitroreductase